MNNFENLRFATIEPFLVRYSTPRTHCEPTPGRYSSLMNMWVVKQHGEDSPLIEAGRNITSSPTRTSQVNEACDPGFKTIIEIATKTMTVSEQDDETNFYSTALDLSTKTKAELEQDDTSPEISNLFL